MFSRGPNRGDFSTRVAVRLPSLCLVERPSHPRGDSKPLAIGQPPNFNEFLVRNQHLQTLTHAMSISGACGESIVENWCQRTGASHQIWAIWHLLQIWWLAPFAFADGDEASE